MNQHISAPEDQNVERKRSRRVPTPMEIALGFSAAFGLANVMGATINPDEFWGTRQQIIEQPTVEPNQCELLVPVGSGGSTITDQLLENLYSS